MDFPYLTKMLYASVRSLDMVDDAKVALRRR